MTQYERWISVNINEATCRNTCRSATAAMQTFWWCPYLPKTGTLQSKVSDRDG